MAHRQMPQGNSGKLTTQELEVRLIKQNYELQKHSYRLDDKCQP